MYHIRRKERDTEYFIERTEASHRYDKVTHFNYKDTGKPAFLVTYRLIDSGEIRRLWVSTYPEHEPPADGLVWVGAVFVMNEQGETIETITN